VTTVRRPFSTDETLRRALVRSIEIIVEAANVEGGAMFFESAC
jgi:hypothetical protein